MNTIDNLLVDLLEWLTREPRPYSEVLEVWRTSCPRLAVWEEATDRALVLRTFRSGEGVFISPSQEGARFLQAKKNSVLAQ